MKTLTLSDLLIALIPIIVYLIHVFKGEKLRIFGNSDGLDISLIFVLGLYATGCFLLIFTEHGQLLTLGSCLVRPTLIFVLQIPAILYNWKWSAQEVRADLNHGMHGEDLDKGAETWHR